MNRIWPRKGRLFVPIILYPSSYLPTTYWNCLSKILYLQTPEIPIFQNLNIPNTPNFSKNPMFVKLFLLIRDGFNLRPCIPGLIILIKTWSQTKQIRPRSKTWCCDFENSTLRRSAIFKSNSLGIQVHLSSPPPIANFDFKMVPKNCAHFVLQFLNFVLFNILQNAEGG